MSTTVNDDDQNFLTVFICYEAGERNRTHHEELRRIIHLRCYKRLGANVRVWRNLDNMPGSSKTCYFLHAASHFVTRLPIGDKQNCA